MLYIGCPMWGYKAWVGNFFPASTPASEFLRLYSQQLTAVEGNTTFYAIPSEEIVDRWCHEAPPTFRFCPKVFRGVSHTLHVSFNKTAAQLFIERMGRLGERLGPMFLQLPAGFSPDALPQLQAFLDFWPANVRLAVEVRNRAFFTEPHASILNSLLQRYTVARVIMDTRPIRVGSLEERSLLHARERKPNLPVQPTITTDLAFVRYIGHPRMEVNEEFLDAWAQQCVQWLRQDITLYVFCHCPFEVHSPEICKVLYQRIRALYPLPPLPWPPEEPEQATLF
ncbi:MAG: DUF72 domain-containing protein [Chloroflexota bacterium]|nr:DUF72 domain-containing protein [Chloroflexota bacterium]